MATTQKQAPERAGPAGRVAAHGDDVARRRVDMLLRLALEHKALPCLGPLGLLGAAVELEDVLSLRLRPVANHQATHSTRQRSTVRVILESQPAGTTKCQRCRVCRHRQSGPRQTPPRTASSSQNKRELRSIQRMQDSCRWWPWEEGRFVRTGCSRGGWSDPPGSAESGSSAPGG